MSETPKKFTFLPIDIPGVSPRASNIGLMITFIVVPFIRLWAEHYGYSHPTVQGGIEYILVPFSHFFLMEGFLGTLLRGLFTLVMASLFLWLYGSIRLQCIKWRLKRRCRANGLE